MTPMHIDGLWLADTALKVSLVLIVAFSTLPFLVRAAARTRALAWTTTLLAVLLIPATGALPSWHVPVLSWPTRAEATEPSVAVASEEAPRAEMTEFPAPSHPEPLEPPSEPVSQNRVTHDQEVIAVDASTWIAGSWAIGTTVLLAMLLLSLTMAGRWRRRAQDVSSPTWRNDLERLRRRLKLSRTVELRSGDHVAGPLTFGHWRPVILLPPDHANWSAERREIVLLHELVHVRHGDWLAQLAARIARAIYWFHPLVRAAVQRWQTDRELACDAAVVAAGIRASTYASQLLALASVETPRRRVSGIGLWMAHPCKLEGRIMALKKNAQRVTSRRSSPWGWLTLGVLTAVGLGTLQPWAQADDERVLWTSESGERVVWVTEDDGSTRYLVIVNEDGGEIERFLIEVAPKAKKDRKSARTFWRTTGGDDQGRYEVVDELDAHEEYLKADGEGRWHVTTSSDGGLTTWTSGAEGQHESKVLHFGDEDVVLHDSGDEGSSRQRQYTLQFDPSESAGQRGAVTIVEDDGLHTYKVHDPELHEDVHVEVHDSSSHQDVRIHEGESHKTYRFAPGQEGRHIIRLDDGDVRDFDSDSKGNFYFRSDDGSVRYLDADNGGNVDFRSDDGNVRYLDVQSGNEVHFGDGESHNVFIVDDDGSVRRFRPGASTQEKGKRAPKQKAKKAAPKRRTLVTRPSPPKAVPHPAHAPQPAHPAHPAHPPHSEPPAHPAHVPHPALPAHPSPRAFPARPTAPFGQPHGHDNDDDSSGRKMAPSHRTLTRGEGKWIFVGPDGKKLPGAHFASPNERRIVIDSDGRVIESGSSEVPHAEHFYRSKTIVVDPQGRPLPPVPSKAPRTERYFRPGSKTLYVDPQGRPLNPLPSGGHDQVIVIDPSQSGQRLRLLPKSTKQAIRFDSPPKKKKKSSADKRSKKRVRTEIMP